MEKSKWLKLKEEDPQRYQHHLEMARQRSKKNYDYEKKHIYYMEKRYGDPNYHKRRAIENFTEYRKEYSRKYREAHREELTMKQRERRQREREEFRMNNPDAPLRKPRTKKIKPPVIPKPPLVKKGTIATGINNKTNIKNTDLIYEIILSKGKGIRTKKLDMIILHIAYGFIKRFYSDFYYWPDMVQSAVLRMMSQYHKYDHLRYDNPFAYFSEICKREMSREVMAQKAMIKYTSNAYKRTFKFVNIDKMDI